MASPPWASVSLPVCQRWRGGGGDELPAHASGPPPSPPPSSLPFQRHYKSNGLERKASKILKPSSIINADSKFPLRAFYIATVTKTRWRSCRSSPPHPTAPGGMMASPEPLPDRPPPGHLPGAPPGMGGREGPRQGKQLASCWKGVRAALGGPCGRCPANLSSCPGGEEGPPRPCEGVRSLPSLLPW